MSAGADARTVSGGGTPPQPPAAPAGKPRRRRRWRPLGLLIRVVLELLLLLLALLGFVLSTQTGLRIAVALAEDLAPDMIRVGAVDGRILGELSLRELRLDLPGLSVNLGRFHLDWSPGALLGGTLKIADLSAADVDIAAEPSPAQESKPFELPQIRLPIAVDIDRVLVERLSFSQIAEQTGPQSVAAAVPAAPVLVLERAELSATANGDRVDLRRLEAVLTRPRLTADVHGGARLTGDYPLGLQLSWQLQQAPALTLTGEGAVEGDLSALDISHRITGSVDLRLRAQARDLLSAPSWTGQVDLAAVELPQLLPDAPPVQLTAALHTEGDLSDATLTGTLSGTAPEVPDLGALDAKLDLGWSDKVLAVRTLHLTETASQALLDLAGTVDLSGPTPAFTLAGAWQRLRWPLVGAVLVESPRGKLAVDGDLDAFRFSLSTEAGGQQVPAASLTLAGTGSSRDAKVDELLLETLGGRIEGTGSGAWSPALAWDLRLSAAGLDPGIRWPGLEGKIGLDAETSGGLEDGFSYQAKADAALAGYPAAVLRLSGTGTGERAQLAELRIETLSGRIDGSGEVAWSPALTWDLRLAGKGLDPGVQYPGLDGRVALDLTSSGGLEEGYAFQLDGDAALSAYPPAVVRIAGTGTAGGATLETLAIQALSGRVDGDAEVTWAPALGWRAGLAASDLDPGQLLADWPGRLGGRVESQGRITDAGPDLTARIIDLGGELRGYPVRVDADAGMQGETLELRELKASSGTTRLSADGRLAGDSLGFRLELASPDLAALLPDAKGRLNVNGSVGGTLSAPAVSLSLEGRDLSLAAQGIERIDGQADVGLGPDGAFRIDVDGSNLYAGGQSFDSLRVTGSGSMPSHRLEVALDGDVLSLRLGAGGALAAGGAYRGTLDLLTLATQQLGTWGLERPAAFALDQGRVDAGPLCIGNGAGSGACASYQQPGPGRFDARLDAERIALDVLNPLLPELMVLNGHVEASARFRGENNAITGNARVQIPTGAVEVALPDTKDQLSFSGTGLDLRLDGAGLAATLALPVEGVGNLDGRVSLPGFDPAAGGNPPLQGAVAVRLTNLSRISNLLPDFTDITGGIDGEVKLGGSLASPDIRGALTVRQVGFKMPLYGLVVSDVGLSVRSRAADALTLDGSALIGGGRLDLSGDVRLDANGPTAKVRVQGRDLKVADSKEYFALLSTDLRAGVGPGGASVQGRVKVPEARIMPRTIPAGAIQPSPDVVLEEPAETKEPVPLHIDLLAELGDEVAMDAFGLRGKLRGSLRVTKAPNGQLLGDGQLEVVDGTYRVTLPGMGLLTSIGKPLTIEQGIVVFAKTPLDNPGLILNAQREGGDVTAGVRVLGTIRSPKLAFFSESDPDLTQSEITTYLVTGMPPKRGATNDERALSVGTYIAPKLFMEYESSLSDQADKVKLRYDLTKSIELQAETGETQGADIFYKFEN